MNNKRVTIVVPMYNSQKYIQECIHSIINQTYKNIQVIIVDDGSTDKSLELCKEIQKKDDRIYIIEQSNSGTAESRRNGVYHAEGEYITFVDSDDYINYDYIESLVSYSEGCQLVTSGLVHGGETLLDGVMAGEYMLSSDSPIVRNMICLDDNITRGILTNMCGKLFDTYIAKDIINDIDPDIFYGEDGEFVYRYILKCEKVSVTNYCGYNYRVNNQSIIHSHHEDFLINVNKLYSSLKDAFNNSLYRNELVPQLERWIALHIRIADEIMNFQDKNLFIKYIIPCKKNIANKNIVVYGAGKVGHDYIRQIKRENLCDNLIWVDKDYKSKETFVGVDVFPVEEVKKNEFDYVLIAVNNEKVAYEVRKQLIEMGIQIDKIIYQKPVYIEDYYK